MSRGDRRMGAVIEHVWRAGGTFQEWSEHFDLGLWTSGLDAAGLDFADVVYRHRDEHEVLPWDHVSAGLHRDFLWQDFQEALAEHGLEDCRWTPCYDCGACTGLGVEHMVASAVAARRGEPGHGAGPGHGRHRAGAVPRDRRGGPGGGPGRGARPVKIRARFTKVGRVRWTSHRDVARMWERALRRGRVPVAYTAGFSPRPQLSFGLALPTGCESIAEYLDIALDAPVDPAELARDVGADAARRRRRRGRRRPRARHEFAPGGRVLVHVGDPRARRRRPRTSTRPSSACSTPTPSPSGASARDVTWSTTCVPRCWRCRVPVPTWTVPMLLAELGTRPRGVRPSELAQALGIELGLARRTCQWIERDGSRWEPLWRTLRVPPSSGSAPREQYEKGSSPCPIRAPGSRRRSPPARRLHPHPPTPGPTNAHRRGRHSTPGAPRPRPEAPRRRPTTRRVATPHPKTPLRRTPPRATPRAVAGAAGDAASGATAPAGERPTSSDAAPTPRAAEPPRPSGTRARPRRRTVDERRDVSAGDGGRAMTAPASSDGTAVDDGVETPGEVAGRARRSATRKPVPPSAPGSATPGPPGRRWRPVAPVPVTPLAAPVAGSRARSPVVGPAVAPASERRGVAATARRPSRPRPRAAGRAAAAAGSAGAGRSVGTSCASTSARTPPRSPCSRAGPSSSTTCRGRPTTPPRSTATSTGAGSRTSCRAWRRPSSTSAPPRTPCSTGATSATTSRTSRRRRAPRRASRRCCGPARSSCARSRRTRSAPKGRASPRRSRSRVGSWSWCPTPPPSASPSDSTTTSASGCAGSSTRCGPPATA